MTVALTPWEFVQHAPLAAKELLTLVGAENSIKDWPPEFQVEAHASFEAGVAVGHVAAGYLGAVVGTVTVSRRGFELRAKWAPPAQ